MSVDSATMVYKHYHAIDANTQGGTENSKLGDVNGEMQATAIVPTHTNQLLSTYNFHTNQLLSIKYYLWA